MTESPYDALDEWLEDVVASTDRELETDRPRPDFAEVVARAHAEDPRRVTAEQLEEVRALAAVIPIQARASESSSSHSAPLDGDFGEFLDDVRAAVNSDIRERQLAGIPAAPGRGASTRRAWRWLAAAAAVVLIGLGVGAGLGGVDGMMRAAPGDGDAKFQAPHARVEVEQAEGRAELRAPSRSDASPRAREEALEEVLEEVPEEHPDAPVATPEGALEEALEATLESSVKATAEASRPSLDERLKALDELAQERWRQGDLEGAEHAYRELIRRGGRRARVQLAYGDLFSLVRQARGGAGEEELWREYLGRFPSGPHADDARAGLCRRAPGDARLTCWERYLDDFPRGAHRAHAVRVTTSPASSSSP
ncbi:MAG: hypothetical protein H6713_11775 [Myxococcales bacterium]|nr:hypothetical protein [Myxococcales bacterium]MCB9750654.1 hypothetical protein [Myxococcales bacterium]